MQKQLQLAEKNRQEYTQKIIDAENEKANKIAELERQLAEKESKKQLHFPMRQGQHCS